MKRAIITHYKNQIILAYLDDERPVEISLYRDNPYPVGTIFHGRIQKIQTNISASFVELAPHTSGFLQKTDYKCGTLLPVQITREGTDTKDPQLTDDISITGKYCVVYAKKGSFHASKKLDKDTRETLLGRVKPLLPEKDRAIILRTNAANTDTESILSEISNLTDTIRNIEQYASARPLCVLYEPPKEWLKALMNIHSDQLDEIVTDDADIMKEIFTAFPNEDPAFAKINLRLYDDPMLALSKLYSLKKHLADALKKRVWLKCGGFLVIEQTEALVSIDVNSGKIAKGSDKEETLYEVNCEAAEEIARQLRLRNLSGIIMVDFINMQQEKHGEGLLTILRDAVEKDPQKTKVYGMTRLGLVEMTRTKERRSLYEQTRNLSDDETVSGDERSI